MQFIATILALAATAVAVPSSGSESSGCTFGQYECSYDGDSIKQCDISGSWVEIGPCPAGTTCADDADNDLPYCFADDASSSKKTKAKRNGDLGWCSAPGTYYCSEDCSGIEVCDSQYELEWNGACPAGTSCQYIDEGAAGEIPFCVSNGW